MTIMIIVIIIIIIIKIIIMEHAENKEDTLLADCEEAAKECKLNIFQIANNFNKEMQIKYTVVQNTIQRR
jgi:hypothetical protein